MNGAATSENTTRYPARCSSSQTNPRPMFPAPKCTAIPLISPSLSAGCRFRSVLVARVEQVVDLLRRLGRDQLVHFVGVREDHRDLAEDLQVAALVTGDPDREPHLVAVPVDRR